MSYINGCTFRDDTADIRILLHVPIVQSWALRGEILAVYLLIHDILICDEWTVSCGLYFAHCAGYGADF